MTRDDQLGGRLFMIAAAALVSSILLLMSAHGQSLVLAGPGIPNSGAACVLWDPSKASPTAGYIFDPSTFTYSGSNFSAGTNGGSAGGSWTAESGTPAKGTALNGLTTIGFAGGQGFVNNVGAWPAGNVYVFAVANIGATQTNSLVSAGWGVGEGRDASHDWVFYPRGGSGFGGSVNEAWIFQGTGAAVITRGDLFTDSSYHIATIKLGTSSDLRKDGTAGTLTTTAGAVNTTTSANVRVGASGPAAAEALTGSVAYLAVLVNPTLADIQNFEGWAAWRFGLQANLPSGHPDKAAPPCVNGPPAPCVTPCDPPPLTWTQVQADSGTLATRPDTNWGPGGPNYPGTSRTPCALGIFAYALPGGYSWACGGDEYLGDPTRWGNTGSYLGVPHTSECQTNKGFDCTAMTEFHLVYVEATAMGGATAKPTVTGTNVWYRNRSSWCHLAAGGWSLMQHAQTGNPIVTGRFDAPQSGNNASALTVTDHGGGVFSEQAPPFAPPPGWANHGWISARGSYSANTVDGCFTYMEARVDQAGDNHIFACGQDWWQSAGAAFPNNTGYSQSSWKRLTVDWTSIVCSALPLALLQADPPPPAVGIGP